MQQLTTTENLNIKKNHSTWGLNTFFTKYENVFIQLWYKDDIPIEFDFPIHVFIEIEKSYHDEYYQDKKNQIATSDQMRLQAVGLFQQQLKLSFLVELRDWQIGIDRVKVTAGKTNWCEWLTPCCFGRRKRIHFVRAEEWRLNNYLV